MNLRNSFFFILEHDVAIWIGGTMNKMKGTGFGQLPIVQSMPTFLIGRPTVPDNPLTGITFNIVSN